MRVLIHEELKDFQRRLGNYIDENTTKSDLAILFRLEKDATYRDMCEETNGEIVFSSNKKGDGDKIPIEVYLHKSVSGVSHYRTIDQLKRKTPGLFFGANNRDRIFEMKFKFMGEICCISRSNEPKDFDSLKLVKSNMFRLKAKLYTEGHEITNAMQEVDILKKFNLKIPKKGKMRKLFEVFDISNEYINVDRNNRAIVKYPLGVISNEYDINSFDTIEDAARFFQTNRKNIQDCIVFNIGFPFRQKRWFFTYL